MDSTSSESGFRIPCEVYFDFEPVPKKYYIFKKNTFFVINDLIRHVKTLFGPKKEVELYIDGLQLPENETIEMIQKDDTLTIKVFSCTNKEKKDHKHKKTKVKKLKIVSCDSFDICPPENEGHLETESERKEPEKNSSLNELNDCFVELEQKKLQILKSQSTVSSSNNADIDISSNNENCELLPDIDFLPPKKKRKRKHKKRLTSLVENNSEEGSVEVLPGNLADNQVDKSFEIELNKTVETSGTNGFSFNNFSQKHIFFPEFPGPSHSSPKQNDKVNKDFRSLLTQLTSMPKSEKVFSRKTTGVSEVLDEDIKSTEGDGSAARSEARASSKTCESSNIVENPREGDTITFTKIKIGENYCPEVSGPIVGKILRVQVPDSQDRIPVVLEILKGSEEFLVPDGKYSLCEEEMELENDELPVKKIAEVYWHEVLEPRLFVANGSS